MFELEQTSATKLGISLPVDCLGLQDTTLTVIQSPLDGATRYMCAVHKPFDRVDIDLLARFVTPQSSNGLPRPRNSMEARFYPPSDSFNRSYQRGDVQRFPLIAWDQRADSRSLRTSREVLKDDAREFDADLGILVAAYLSPELLEYWHSAMPTEAKVRLNRISDVPVPTWISQEAYLRKMVVYTPLFNKLEEIFEFSHLTA